MNPKDILAIEQAVDLKNSTDLSTGRYLIHDYTSLKSNLNQYGQHFFKCLAYLIASDRVQIVATRPKGTLGITHYKAGILSDGIDRIMFNASCNFTYSGLLENLEVLEVKQEWGSEKEQYAIAEQEIEFEQIFTKQSDLVEYLDTTQLKEHIQADFGGRELKELLDDERKLLTGKKQKINNPVLLKLIEEAEQRIMIQEQAPRFPHQEGPRQYQIQAYQKWVQNGHQGLFAMATGTGKTLTALNCILEEYRLSEHYNVIVAVPTKALALQWAKEVQQFNFKEIISTVTDKDWSERLSRFNYRQKLKKLDNVVIVTTYATFNGKKFRTGFLGEIPNPQVFTLVADEAHNLGSPQSLQYLPQTIIRRIGLSATPERVYDDIGSSQLYHFFNAQPPCYTFSYSMKKAIDAGVLCQYDYFPLLVSLEEDEAKEYRDLTVQLMSHFDQKTERFKDSAKWLLMSRKRVIHKARNKKIELEQILTSLQAEQKRLQYTFIYVPEGYEVDNSQVDEYTLDVEDVRIIDDYSESLIQAGYRTHQFLGETDDPQRIIRQFAEGKIDILLAMKCLDEGVDVPRTETAIFCSSTGNPRQFVQRRGRILRVHPAKPKARIYDMVVVPPFASINQSGAAALSSHEVNIFRNELRRVVNFVSLSDNQIDFMSSEVCSLCDSLSIDIHELVNEFKEQQKQCDSE
ncbi:MAG: DEAD/DEAH box helicase family protein [Janthinobacterium lividum]